MRRGAPELLVKGLGFPECPRWHDGRLWISDIMVREILWLDDNGSPHTFAELPARAMGTGWLPDGTMLVSSMDDARLLRCDGGRAFAEVADLRDVTAGLLNDLVVDGLGRTYVGCTGRPLGTGDRKPTSITLVADGQPPRVVASDFVLTNGMAVSADNRRLVVADTLAGTLTAFTIADDGSLVDRRLFADLGDEVPNGICGDAEGAIWVASHTGSFLRVLEGGRIADRVQVAGGRERMAVACMLGGADGRRLFMASTDHLPGPQAFAENAERSGRIDVLTVDVPGAGWP
jgi:sugar lactone lactonase YvrE